MKWILKEQKISLFGFGFNFTDWKAAPHIMTDECNYTFLSIDMGIIENAGDLSKTLLSRNYPILTHRKDVQIMDSNGVFYVLSVENERLDC